MTEKLSAQSARMAHRNKLAEKLENNTLVLIYSGKDVQKISDLEVFYPSNNFVYFTGIKEDDSTLLLYKGSDGEVTEILFIPKSDPVLRKWVGRRTYKSQARYISGIKTIAYSSELPDYLQEYISKTDPVIKLDLSQPEYKRNNLIEECLKDRTVEDISAEIEELRLIKDPYEIKKIKQAIKITKFSLSCVIQLLEHTSYEMVLAHMFELFAKMAGADGLSFPSIVAGGENATILHYTKNNSILYSNDLVLFDVGARIDGYCADVSRTFPVSGEFSEQQKQFYRAVLNTQKEVIKHYVKGARLKDIQKLTKKLLAQNLENEGISLPKRGINKWYYHNIGHSLGLDTHDSQNKDLVLENGMVVTCEPGIYAEEYNIGIRIEDDILISDDEPIILTENIPKEIEEVEDLFQEFEFMEEIEELFQEYVIEENIYI